MHVSLAPTLEVLPPPTPDTFQEFVSNIREELPSDSPVFAYPPSKALRHILALPEISTLLINLSRADVFSPETAQPFAASESHLDLLPLLKLLKYAYNLPLGHLVMLLSQVIDAFDKEYAKQWNSLSRAISDDSIGRSLFKHLTIASGADPDLKQIYQTNADYLLENDPHALYPTSVYRQCVGHVSSTSDSKLIEGVMGTTITTTIRIVRGVLDPSNNQLRDVYKPLGRCIAVVDERVDGLYGDEMNAYFAAHDITFEKLVYRCMEVDKDISTVEKILVDLKGKRVSRNEPVLVVGGGVMADVGGFACALYHRNTPYVMLCTSIVSGIDAGPSPRTCCDGLGYKNVFGAYHPPILTLTDREFFKTLEPGWIRHGIAEIIKMAATKDVTLFEDLERAGNRLVETKFGVENCERGSEIDILSDTIIAKAMDGYVRAEYGNLWETHQCRPHAYGHTWSPGFELQAGLLHGHAVSIGMGFSAYLSYLEGWITQEEFHRILDVMSIMGLALRHDILENPDSLWASQLKMTEKRGGNLCAPIPRGTIGECGYLNELTREKLENTLIDYQEYVKKYSREGFGIEPHCHDVGLEDPSTVKQHADNAVLKGSISKDATNGHSNGHTNGDANGHTNGNANGHASSDEGAPVNGSSNIDEYNKWIAEKQVKRNEGVTSSSLGSDLLKEIPADTPTPPKYDASTLFYPVVEEYAGGMTTLPSEDYQRISAETEKSGLFAPCMVGQMEGQFLKMITQIKGAKRVLDIGTFTGYSALSFADGLPADGEVLTVEADAKTAAVARECIKAAKNGHKVKLHEGDARVYVSELAESGEKFDIIFLDADKTNYRNYYESGLGMLNEGGLLMADNALCSLVYSESDPVSRSLHEFAQFVRRDDRVEQVMLTVREGILMVQKV